MKKLEKLTPEQAAVLPVVRDEWIARALSGNAHIDLAQAREAIDGIYRLAGLERPALLIEVGSPMGCQLAANFIATMDQVRDQVRGQVGDQVRRQVRDQVWDQVRGQVWDQVGDQVWRQVWGQVWDQVGDQVGGQVWRQVWGQVWDQVGDQVGGQVGDQVWRQVRGQVGGQVRRQVGGQVRDQVGDQVGGQVWDQVRGQVGGQVGGQVWDQVWDQVRGQVWDQVRGQVWRQVRGQVWRQVRGQVGGQKLEFFDFGCWGTLGWDCHWLSWADCMRRLGVGIVSEGFDFFMQLAMSGVWDCVYLRGAVIVCPPPAAVSFDGPTENLQLGFLHNQRGPAVLWRDGYANYRLHGIVAEREWIENPASLTAEFVLNYPNAEVRRVLILQMGERFGHEVIDKSTILDTDTDASGMPRRLFQLQLDNETEPYTGVEVQCPSTGKLHYLRVPPTMTRCSQAIAWTFGFEAPDLYRPLVEA